MKASVSLPDKNKYRHAQHHRHSFSCHFSQHTFVLQVVMLTGGQLRLNIYLSFPDGCYPSPGSLASVLLEPSN